MSQSNHRKPIPSSPMSWLWPRHLITYRRNTLTACDLTFKSSSQLTLRVEQDKATRRLLEFLERRRHFSSLQEPPSDRLRQRVGRRSVPDEVGTRSLLRNAPCSRTEVRRVVCGRRGIGVDERRAQGRGIVVPGRRGMVFQLLGGRRGNMLLLFVGLRLISNEREHSYVRACAS